MLYGENYLLHFVVRIWMSLYQVFCYILFCFMYYRHLHSRPYKISIGITLKTSEVSTICKYMMLMYIQICTKFWNKVFLVINILVCSFMFLYFYNIEMYNTKVCFSSFSNQIAKSVKKFSCFIKRAVAPRIKIVFLLLFNYKLQITKIYEIEEK